MCCLFIGNFSAEAQSEKLPNAQTLLERSIQYHDPGAAWGKGIWQLNFYESRPDACYRLSGVYMDHKADLFRLTQQIDQNQVIREVKAGVCQSQLNGRSDFSSKEAESFGLNCDRNTMYRNYFNYLWGMPMKLKDPGTRIDPVIKQKDFFGKQVLEMRVTYDPEVGKDIWYFYFHPETYALEGYRFYHDESANDGEYILFEGEVMRNGVKFPARRTWYTHKEDKVLGTDELLSY